MPYGRKSMLNYDEELKKFKPILSVEEVEEAIYGKDMTDVIDLLKEMQNAEAGQDEGASE